MKPPAKTDKSENWKPLTQEFETPAKGSWKISAQIFETKTFGEPQIVLVIRKKRHNFSEKTFYLNKSFWSLVFGKKPPQGEELGVIWQARVAWRELVAKKKKEMKENQSENLQLEN